MTIPSIDVVFGVIDSFPEINAPNYSTLVQEVCDQHKVEVDRMNTLIEQLNTYKTAVNTNKEDFTTDIATMEQLKADIAETVSYIDLAVLQQIKDEMDLINLVADDAELIQDTADLVRSVKLNYLQKNTDYIAVHNDYIYADTSAGSFNITLPENPTQDEKIFILDTKGTFKDNNLTVLRNGKNIMGVAEDMILDVENIEVGFIFNGIEWRVK